MNLSARTAEDFYQSNSKWRELSSLPNCKGFEFIGLTHDGREVNCVIERNSDGRHSVKEFAALKAWRHK